MGTDTTSLRQTINAVAELSKLILDKIDAGTYTQEEAQMDLEDLSIGDYSWYSAIETYSEGEED